MSELYEIDVIVVVVVDCSRSATLMSGLYSIIGVVSSLLLPPSPYCRALVVGLPATLL